MYGKRSRLRILLAVAGGLFGALWLGGCAFSYHHEEPATLSAPHSGGSGSHTVGVSETFRKTYAAGKVKTLRVRDEMGAIEVRPVGEDRDEIRIEATKTVQGGRLSEADLRALLAKVQITAHLDGDTLVVEASHEQDGFPEEVSANVGFILEVPKRLALDLRTDNSPITATGSEGGVTLRTSNGSIELMDSTGKVDAQTSNAPITLNAVHARESLKLITTNGSIQCGAIQADANPLTVFLETDNGPVQYAGDATNATLHSTNGEITFTPTANLPLDKAEILTNNAPIVLTLPASLSATVDAHTTNANITFNGSQEPNPQTADTDHTERRIVLNGGKAAITAHTYNGSISLESR